MQYLNVTLIKCDHQKKIPIAGLSHGKCECNKCKCEPDFQGEDCGCPISSSTCLSKNNVSNAVF